MEENILIAEFMGYTIGELHGFISGSNQCSYKKENGEIINAKRVEKLKYRSSWDWIMPVVEKIEATELGDIYISEELFLKAVPCIRIQYSYCYLDIAATMKAYDDFMECENAPSKIDGVYNVVIQFIQWYNKNK